MVIRSIEEDDRRCEVSERVFGGFPINRRLLVLAIVLVAGMLFLVGCGQPTRTVDTPTFTPPVSYTTELRAGDAYTLTLDASDTTSSTWQVEFDTAFLELVERAHTSASDLAGGGGKEVFTFRALRPGVTEAYFSYTRTHEVIVNFTIGVASDVAMNLDEAMDIARGSACTEVGALMDNASLNEWTGTWWIGLAAEKPGCSPACVVNIAEKTAEVNWRCTGALPPSEDVEESSVPSVPDAGEARDAALAYLRNSHTELAPTADLTWSEENITEQGIVGATAFRYTSGAWVVVVSYPVVNPKDTVYQVEVSNPDSRLLWQGDVDATGNVTETRALGGPQPVVCWGGFVKSLPAGGQFDDYLALEDDTGVGIDTADNTVAAQIQTARDTGTFVHLWGKLLCPAIDYGGCQLVVTRLREDKPGPLPEPDPVEGWTGIITSLEPGTQHDAAFTLIGDIPVRLGVGSTDPEVEAQLSALRDSGEIVRLWGSVTCGVPSVNGAYIEVTRIERLGVQ